jgi:cell cycle sensor histidine kinase DivJ
LTAGVNLANEVKAGVFANADRRAIKQAMVNLLSNAIKFTPTEGTVTVSINPRADGVDLVVADTGVGIPAGDLERIGKPFEQVSGMKSLHRGTGLGLSLVKALIELHQGHMTIVSALGDGTTVTLSIPDGEAEADQIPEDPTLVYPARFKVRA